MTNLLQNIGVGFTPGVPLAGIDPFLVTTLCSVPPSFPNSVAQGMKLGQLISGMAGSGLAAVPGVRLTMKDEYLKPIRAIAPFDSECRMIDGRCAKRADCMYFDEKYPSLPPEIANILPIFRDSDAQLYVAAFEVCDMLGRFYSGDFLAEGAAHHTGYESPLTPAVEKMAWIMDKLEPGDSTLIARAHVEGRIADLLGEPAQPEEDQSRDRRGIHKISRDNHARAAGMWLSAIDKGRVPYSDGENALAAFQNAAYDVWRSQDGTTIGNGLGKLAQKLFEWPLPSDSGSLDGTKLAAWAAVASGNLFVAYAAMNLKEGYGRVEDYLPRAIAAWELASERFARVERLDSQLRPHAAIAVDSLAAVIKTAGELFPEAWGTK